MSYRTAILVDRYVSTFSDSETQPQRTTTVQYSSSLVSGDDTMSEITTAAIGNYPTHSIPNAVSSPFNIEFVGADGSHAVIQLERQTNLQSTHCVTIGGVKYVRVPYRYGYTEEDEGKKSIFVVPLGEERFVWHSNLDENEVASFNWDAYFESNDGHRLDEVPDFLKGSFIFTEDQEQKETYGEAPETDKVWPALKILTDEDFKAVYISDDLHYYFLVDVDGTDILIGDVGEKDEPPYIFYDGGNGEFLKGVMLNETKDAAILNGEQEKIVTLDMQFGDEWYRVAGTDEVVHVIIPEQGDETEYHIILNGEKLPCIRYFRTIAEHLKDEDYAGLVEAKNYIETNGTVDESGLYTVTYPNTVTEIEKEGIIAKFESGEVPSGQATYTFVEVNAE